MNILKDQTGSTGIIATVLIVGAVGMKVVSDRIGKSNQVNKQIKTQRVLSNAEASNLSALDYVNNLFTYENGEPAIYAQDYFADKWVLLSNKPKQNIWTVKGNTIELKLPETEIDDFTEFHKTGDFSIQKTRQSTVRVASIERARTSPYIEAQRMYVTARTDLLSSGIDKKVSKDDYKEVSGLLNLRDVPDPQIFFYTSSLTSTGHIGEGKRQEIKGDRINVQSPDINKSIFNVDIMIKGIADGGKYEFGGQSYPLNTEESKNYKSFFIADDAKLEIDGAVAKTGACSFSTVSTSHFEGIDEEELEEFEEWHAIANNKKKAMLKELSKQAEEGIKVLQKDLEGVLNTVEAGVTYLPDDSKDDADDFIDELNDLVKIKDDKKYDKAEDYVDDAKEARSDMRSVSEDKDDESSFYDPDKGAMTIAEADQALKIAEDILAAIDRYEATKDAEDDVEASDQITTSTQEFELPKGADLLLRVTAYNVKGEAITRDLIIEANSAPSNCKCSDVGMKSYTGISRAKLSSEGGGGDVCYTGKRKGATLYALFGRNPQCVTQEVQTGRKACGCFDENTMITMVDKSLKKISEIQTGDVVYNPVTNKGVPVMYVSKGPEDKAMLRIHSGGKKVLVTSKHPFPTERGILPAFRLIKGDVLIGDGSATPIEKIEVVESKDKPVVYNLMLAGKSELKDHMLIGNGMVTGDLWIQNRLEQSRQRNELLGLGSLNTKKD